MGLPSSKQQRNRDPTDRVSTEDGRSDTVRRMSDASEIGGTCMRCGYDLTGLDDRRPCPECGLLAGISRKSGDALRDNHPRWLGRLTLGVCCLAVAVLTLPLIGVGVALLDRVIMALTMQATGPRFWVFRAPSILTLATPVDWVLIATGCLLALLPVLLLPIGLFLIGNRSSYTGGPGHRFRHLGVRLLPIVPLVAVLMSLADTLDLLDSLGTGAARIASQLGPYAAILSFAAVGWISIVVSLRLRRLAERAPAPLLAADSPIIGVVVGVILIVGSAFMLSLYSELFRVPGQGLLMSIVFTTVVVFVSVLIAALIWSVYLLIRYAIAFASTRRQALQAFAEADRSG